MGKYRYLAKNVGLMTIGQFGSRILSFLLVPLYTSILSTADYGTFDFYSTIIQLLVPVLTLNIYDGILRFALDREEDINQVYAVGCSVFLAGVFVLLLLVAANLWIGFLPIVNDYPWLFFLYFIVYALSLLLNNFARGVDDVTATVLSGIISTFAMAVFNIWFLVGLHMGLSGYFWANIGGMGAGCLLYIFKLRLWQYPIKLSDFGLCRRMVRYSSPLVLNSVSWWLNSASSRYIVIGIEGIAANGLFSAAGKIPSIISMAANLFNSAWVMSSVKEFDPKDKDGFFSKTYRIFSSGIMICCALLIAGSCILGEFLYQGQFYTAWRMTPLLTIGVSFSAIAGYLGCIFAAAKKTKVYTYSTFAGFIANVIIGVILTIPFGIMGTAMATALANYIILAIRFIQIRGFMHINMKLVREHIVYALLFIESFVVLNVEGDLLWYIPILIIVFVVIVLYRHELIDIYKKLIVNHKIKDVDM